ERILEIRGTLRVTSTPHALCNAHLRDMECSGSRLKNGCSREAEGDCAAVNLAAALRVLPPVCEEKSQSSVGNIRAEIIPTSDLDGNGRLDRRRFDPDYAGYHARRNCLLVGRLLNGFLCQGRNRFIAPNDEADGEKRGCGQPCNDP